LFFAAELLTSVMEMLTSAIGLLASAISALTPIFYITAAHPVRSSRLFTEHIGMGKFGEKKMLFLSYELAGGSLKS
jgi:hypothetical protein